MTEKWRDVRVFISSTFCDMHAERDWLVERVFPYLREQLLLHSVHLIDIDLRWGITEEQAENDQTLDLCLQQIDNSQPLFFIGILGQRYGWVPDTIPRLSQPEYRWLQDMVGKSVTELEIIHGVLNNPQMKGQAFFYFRDPAALNDVPEDVRRSVYEETSPGQAEKLVDLKNRIRASGHAVVESYPAVWDPQVPDKANDVMGCFKGLEIFGEKVSQQLLEAILDHLGLPEQPGPEVETDQRILENDYHERFLESGLRFYIERSTIQEALLRHIETGQNRTLMVSGPSGAGKTATLSWLCRAVNRQYPNAYVIPHFVGASEASTSLGRTLERSCAMISRRFRFNSGLTADGSLSLSTVTEKQISRFRDCLIRVPDTERLILIIDAIDQLDPAGQPQELAWLPDSTPQNVWIIVSCDTTVSPNRVWERAREKGWKQIVLGPLTAAEQLDMVRHIPAISAKTLDDTQIDLLLANAATTNPLFLTIILEELRVFGLFDHLNKRIAAFPQGRGGDNQGEEIRALFGQIIERLELAFHPHIVQSFLSLLACSCNGLTEAELKQLFAGSAGEQDFFPVLRQLRDHLMKRGTLIDFRHHELRQTVCEVYLRDSVVKKGWHDKLAEFFECIGDVDRQTGELPFQLAEAGQWTKLYEKMAETAFLNTLYKCNREEQVSIYWSLIEQKTPHRLLEAFHDVTANPQQYDYSSLWNVSTLLASFGHHLAAIEIRQLLSDLSQGPESINLINANLNLAASMRCAGKVEDALALLQTEEARCRKLIFGLSFGTTLGKRIPYFQHLLVDCLAGQAIIFYDRHELQKALALQSQCESICRTIQYSEGIQRALGEQGLIKQAQGNLQGAMELYLKKEQMCRELGNQEGLQFSYGYQASVYLAWGNYHKAGYLQKKRREMCRKLGMLDSLVSSLDNEALFLRLHKNEQGALASYREQEQILRELHSESDLNTCLKNIVELCEVLAQRLFEEGNCEGSWGFLEQLEHALVELGDEENLGMCFANQAMICFITGERERGLSLLRKKEVIDKKHGKWKDYIELLDQMILLLRKDMYFMAAICIEAERQRLNLQ